MAHKPIDLARPKENETHVGFLPIERAWMDSQGFNIFFRSNLQAVYTVQRTIDGGINWEDVGEPVFGEMESTVIDSNIYRNAAYRLKVPGTEFLDFYNY